VILEDEGCEKSVEVVLQRLCLLIKCLLWFGSVGVLHSGAVLEGHAVVRVLPNGH